MLELLLKFLRCVWKPY